MVQRTEYRHLTTDTIRGGPTGHGESLADMESYLLPLARLQARSHFISGVLEGLRVSASLGQAAVQVSIGSALDGAGNLIALVVDGFAVIDPDVDIEAVENVPTVVVGSEGVSVPTTGASAQSMLVIRWREVSGTAGTFVRLHAPCVRLVPFDTFVANDRDVPLARVAIGAAGAVEELDVDRRDLAELRAGSVQLWAVKSETNGAIAQQPVAELFGTDGPGVGLTVSGRRALTIDGGTLQATFAGDVVLQGALRRTGGLSVDGDATLSGGLTVNGGPGVHSGGNLASYSFADRSVATFVGDPQAGERWVWYADAATARLWSGADKFWVNKDGNVGLGIAVGDPIHRTVYVGGPNSSGIHIEGSGAGYSFADRRQPPGYVDNPDGQRWVWYAIDGTARLWSGRDLLTVGSPGGGGGLEVWGRMRMREGKGSAGAWFFQNEIPDERPAADRAFIGMEGYDTVGLFGAESGWSLVMNVGTGNVLHSGREFGNPSGPYVLQLFGSRIQDVGGGVLNFRSGGNNFAFEGGGNIVFGRAGRPCNSTFNGQLVVNGNLIKPAGTFRIDHPLDPTGAYLSHSFVESPERLNLYAGTVVTDTEGRATIELPAYFDALNRDPLVQLTPFGQLAQVAVCAPIEGKQVSIVSDVPGVTVAWQVSGVRQDAWARLHPMVVEEPKPAAERGTYLHPEAFESVITSAPSEK